MIIDRPIKCRHRTPEVVEGEPVITMARKLVRRKLFDEFPFCRYCGKRFQTYRQSTIDHLDPVSQGGGERLSNITICCGHCNFAKYNRSLAEWRKLLQRQLINVTRLMAERDES